MLKKCSEQDRKRLTEYLYQNPVLNLFIIGDLYNYGFDSDIQDLYIDCVWQNKSAELCKGKMQSPALNFCA
ncbi:hypothetical protein EB31_00155 [Enterococcus cecorum]|nr:hypothetical protein EB31_00155 [Enterococcus cecorum]